MLNRTTASPAAHRSSPSHGKNPQSLKPLKPCTITTSAFACRGASTSPRIGKPSREGISNIEAEQDHVPILHCVLFSFAAHLARCLGRLLAAETDVVVVRDRLGADEAPLEVAVNDARGLW